MSDIIVPTKATNRSRVTNGGCILAGVDGRSPAARRYRDVLDSLLAQLGRAPTESDMILCRRAARLAVDCEEADARRIRGEAASDTVTAANALRRVLADLGLSTRRRRGPVPQASPRPFLPAQEGKRA